MSNDSPQRPDNQDRFEQHQRIVADQERANRIKAQDLMQRERKLEDDQRILNQERKMLIDTRDSLISSRQRRSALVLPLLLVAAVAAGIFAFQNIEQQKRYYEQVTEASKNIDKLAKVLSVTQDEVVITTSKLSTKQVELERTKAMLSELRTTTDQLQFEISQLKGGNTATIEETNALSLSAGTLSGQLAQLRSQLEENYLTNDINEVYIEYQENDLRRAQQALLEKEQELNKQQNLIGELQAALSSNKTTAPVSSN